MNRIRIRSMIRVCIVGVVSIAGAQSVVAQCAFDWRPGDGEPTFEYTLSAMTTWDPDGPGPLPATLVVGGAFSTAGGVPAEAIACWDGATWQPLGAGINGGLNPRVYVLTVFNGDLIAGGDFTSAGGVSANNIARWDGMAWHPLGTGMNGRVRALTVHNNELIAGGQFTTAGDVAASRIARWDGMAWHSLGSGMGGSGASVFAVAVYNADLIAGGLFTTAGGVSAYYIARWDGMGWHPLGTGVAGNYPWVTALAVYGGELIVGGAFTTAGDNVSPCWARWGPDCARGDLNCDQLVDSADVPLFVDALLSTQPLTVCEAYTANVNGDMDCAGGPRVDASDIQPFVDCVLGGLCP